MWYALKCPTSGIPENIKVYVFSVQIDETKYDLSIQTIKLFIFVF